MSSFVFFLTILFGFAVFSLIAVRRIFDAPFLFVMHGGALMGIPPLLHLLGFSLDYPYLNDFNKDSANLLLALIIGIFLAATSAGYLVFRHFTIGGFIFPDFNYKRSRILIFFGVLILTFFGFLVILFPLASVGFNPVAAIAKIRQDGFFFGGLNFIRQFLFFGTMISGAFFLSLLREKKDGAKISRYFTATIFVLFMINIVMSVILGGKSFVIFPLGAVIIGYELCIKRRGYMRLIFGLLVILSLIISLQFLRTHVVTQSQRGVFDNIYTGLYLTVYDTSLLYVETHNKRHFTATGEDFKNGLILLIPRIFWSDKPQQNLTAGNRFARQIMPNTESSGGKPPFGAAQWYTNFGWGGVLIGGLLTGWIIALLQTKYADFRQNPFHFVIMWHVIFMVLGPWPGGLHNTSLMHYALYIFPLFIFRFLSDRKLLDTKK